MIKRGKVAIWAVVLCLVLTGVFIGMSGAVDVERMSKDDLKSHLGDPDVIILDVRLDRDWQASEWKIQGAVHEESKSVESWMNKYSKNKKIVLYCA